MPALHTRKTFLCQPAHAYLCCVHITFFLSAVLCLVTQCCHTLWNPMDCRLPGSSVHGYSPGKNTGVSFRALLQRIFPIQGLNPGLLHCRWILYQLSYQGSPRILEWIDYPSSRGSSHWGIKLGSPALQADSLPAEQPRKSPYIPIGAQKCRLS